MSDMHWPPQMSCGFQYVVTLKDKEQIQQY